MSPGRSPGTEVTPGTLIDGHAHFHERFRLDRFLDAANANFDRAQSELLLPATAGRALLIMETGSPSLLERLETHSGSWSATAAEPASARVERPGATPILLVEGRQVVTHEGLEVLAVPTCEDLPQGRNVRDTLDAAHNAGAVPVLPWGVGKWLGSRGRAVAELLDQETAGRFLLGDNGGRLRWTKAPRLLALGVERGFGILRGSDPLPLGAENGRVGSFGSLLEPLDPLRPTSSLRDRLTALRGSPPAFGRGTGPLRFLLHQLRMQLRKAGR